MKLAGTENEDLIAEIRRRYRVADMMITMHSILRDTYSFRTIVLDSAIFLSSIVIAALAFVDPDLLDWLPWAADSTRIMIGLVAVFTFFIGLVSARVDWKGKSDAHARAAAAYTQAKFKLNPTDSELNEEEIRRTLLQYEEIARTTITVPDSKFLRLKAEHYMKISLSRILDRFPAASIRLTRLRLRLRHSRNAWAEKEDSS